MVERLLSRGGGVDDSDESFQAECSRKKARCLEFCQDEQNSAKRLLSISICTMSADHLSLRLQHLDAKGGGLLELVDRRERGLLRHCQRWLFNTFNHHMPSDYDGYVPAMLWHLRASEADENNIMEELLSCLASIGAAFFRFELRFHRRPFYRWIEGHITPSADKEFINSNSCCRDQTLDEPVHATYPTEVLASSPEAADLRTKLAKEVPVTNMTLEGLLSEIRIAAPRCKSAPSAEKVCYVGYLNQAMKQHLQGGRKDSRSPDDAKELVSKGVPLDRISNKPTYTRPDASWFCHRKNLWKRLHHAASASDNAEINKRLRCEWAQMSPRERETEVGKLLPRAGESRGEDTSASDNGADEVVDEWDAGRQGQGQGGNRRRFEEQHK